jgi:hypothetical protein
MEELHTDSIDGGHEGQLWARSRARERAYSNNFDLIVFFPDIYFNKDLRSFNPILYLMN